MRRICLIAIPAVTVFLAACGGRVLNNSSAPIILGDSSTIVTETDSQYLQDAIPDLEVREQPVAPAAVVADTTVAPPVADTAIPKPAVKIEGFNISLGDAAIVIQGPGLKENKKQDNRQNDLSYVLSSGSIGSAKLVFMGVKNVEVQQRYLSSAGLKSGLGTLDLKALGQYTSGWEKLAVKTEGDNKVSVAQGLNNPKFQNIGNAKIKNAADQALRAQKISKKDTQKWQKEISRMRSMNDKPGTVSLDAVEWTVTGTDTKGKSFKKTIRVAL